MKSDLDKTTLLDMYRTMLLIRQCEEALARSHQRGLVPGACHTYVGQEAVAAGVCAHLRSREATRDLPLLMVTSRSTAKHHDQAYAAGSRLYQNLFAFSYPCQFKDPMCSQKHHWKGTCRLKRDMFRLFHHLCFIHRHQGGVSSHGAAG